MPLAVKSRIVKGFANCGYRLAALVRLLRWGVTHMQTTGFALRGKSVFTILAFAFLPLEVTAAPGGTFTNGTTSTDPPGVVIPAFLFEPEAPLQSLKTAPIWNELEQMLDNPYSVALCSALPATVDPLVRNTPGTTQIPGSPPAPVYPAYCSIAPRGRPAFGVTLPPLLVHPLNYNPTTGEEMRLLNPDYPGGTWLVPEELVQSEINPDLWSWRYRHVDVSDGSRVEQAEINYNAPFRADVASSEMFARMFANAASSGTNAGLAAATGFLDIPLLGGHCITTTEPWPSPEGAINCGGDPGEPGGTVLTLFGRVSTLPAFGVNRPDGYSRPAIPGVASTATPIAGATNIVTGLSARLFDATRGGNIPPRNAAGAGGLNKPSLRVPAFGGTPANPNYLHNTDRDDVAPSNENDFIQNRTVAAALGKAFFWDMQVGSDAVQSCGSCHAHAAADNRTKNQMNPNSLGGDSDFEVRPPNGELVASDFPFQKLGNPDVAGDPKCAPPTSEAPGNVGVMRASVNAGVLENNFPNGVSGLVVCDAANAIPNKNNAMGAKVVNDVASSMGVHFGRFLDIPTPGGAAFGPASGIGGVRSVLPDLRSPVPEDNIDPIPGFAGVGGHDIRRVEPRNTPVILSAALNFDNFWDGRARHDFNGGSVFGPADPQSHVFVNSAGTLVPTRQIIRFASIASLATGPGLSEFEMSLLGRNWAKIGKKLLQDGVTPLANQLVAPTDSVLGPYSNQGGSACAGLPVVDRAGSYANTPVNVLNSGKPGLCISYRGFIRQAFYPSLRNNAASHLDGCYTDGRADIHPNQCTEGSVPVLTAGEVNTANIGDPFDGYKLTPVGGAADPANTNQFTQAEGNFALFWGLAVHTWVTILLPDNTPFDQFLDQNPDMFESIGEVGEPGLVGPLPTCTSATQRRCFREVGKFKRDANLNCNNLGPPGEGATGNLTITPCRGTRIAGQSDPLLGMDIFQGSNFSLKNPNFRAARCGECHAGATLTDHSIPFTFKAQLGDFIGEFIDAGNEALIEPLGRPRVISGFLLESELSENGQDGIERRIANQSIVPCPVDGLAYPGGSEPGSGQGHGVCSGAGQSFFDNGVYNLGVTRCEANHSQVTGYCDDNGRGNTDAFGWPLSLAALLLKNLGGPGQEPGTPVMAFDPDLGGGGGLFEESAQDQEINPGEGGEVVNPQLPAYLAGFASEINVGDAMPDLDELNGGINTLTDVAMLEGFVDTLGPFNPAGLLNESMNNGEGPFEGTWPDVNRVGRFGSFKAPQLREVELTGPYFHNGGKLTLRQVVDFYTRGGDFPMTNAQHRDFNIINQNIEVQSNLSEAEKVALVDFLLELTDERVRFERAPFDHPQVIVPLDGTAPENTIGRDGMLAECTDPAAGTPSPLGPGQRACNGGLFLDIPAVGSSGSPAPIPNFLGISSGPRLAGAAAFCGPAANNHYCR